MKLICKLTDEDIGEISVKMENPELRRAARGIVLREDGKILSFLRDEPYNEKLKDEIIDSDWILHEAFCLDSDEKIFKPYEKGHATVKSASIVASELNVKNLILWHSEDSDLENRKSKYIEEAKKYFCGNIFVPNDFDVIKL